MRRRISKLWAAVISGVFITFVQASSASATSFTFVTIDHPDTTQSLGTNLTGINNLGAVVGLYGDFGGSPLIIHAFTLASDYSTFVSADILDATRTVTWSINDAGNIVGASWAPDHQGFVRSNDGSSVTFLDVPGSNAGTTTATGINASDVIVGYSKSGSHFTLHAFIRLPDGASSPKK